MFRFEDLEIWKLSMVYCNNCYEIANGFPDYEKFALSSQLRRAGISVSNNISEGSGSESNKMFCRYLNISISSIYETINIIIFSEQRGYSENKIKDKMYRDAELLIKKIKSFKRSLNN